MSYSTRSNHFHQRDHSRYWWYKIPDNRYTPPIFSGLSNEEWDIMDNWFSTTEQVFDNPGEMAIPGISFVAGLIGGNGIHAIVQCGHYAGYSTLLLGFLLRSMGKKNALFSIDIDAQVTQFTREWVKKAGIEAQVNLCIANSADATLPAQARAYFGRDIQMVIIDSSHQYAHTLTELDLWYDALPVGGLIVMHDVSRCAQTFDATKEGGVLRAVQEWAKKRKIHPLLLNDFVTDQFSPDNIYRDGCGIALIQKQPATLSPLRRYFQYLQSRIKHILSPV
jgi:predicted O-methyltransferase YrrM